MNYEEKYNQALERARMGLHDCNLLPCDDMTRKAAITTIYNLFPELADDDERIRKGIIRNLQYLMDRSEGFVKEDLQERIAWLEKQGEQKPTLPKWKYKKDHTPLLRDSLILNKYGCVAKSPSGAIVSDVWVLDYDELAKLPKEEFEKQGETFTKKDVDDAYLQGISDAKQEIEKQGENNQEPVQKPFDYEHATIHQKDFAPKDEPKFHPEDWIVDDETPYDVFCVIEVLGEIYKVIDADGDDYHIPHCKADKQFHLWSISDAKDGDVLFHSDSASNGIFIFKEILQRGTIQEVVCYCDYDSEDGFCLGEKHTCCWTDSKILHPATKEKRDLLFEKMKEAGYEWDAEKKELKKIEQDNHPRIVIRQDFNDGEGLYKINLDNLNEEQVDAIEMMIKNFKQCKKLDADKVIAWLVANICDFEYYVKLFKQDFGL